MDCFHLLIKHMKVLFQLTFASVASEEVLWREKKKDQKKLSVFAYFSVNCDPEHEHFLGNGLIRARQASSSSRSPVWSEGF